jgi:leader peptidase (prepilin peptidase)/N-methyltransferase
MAEALWYVTAFHPWLWLVLGGVLGAVLGSFFTCAAYRVPRGISLRKPVFSFCPCCNHRLTVPDLIPIGSWLALRGRCRHCGGVIPLRSLGLEIAATAAGVGLTWLLLHL